MKFKNYNEQDLLNNQYAILQHDEEEPIELIAGLYDNLENANKRLNNLKKDAERQFEKGINITGYTLVKANEERVRKCFNYESEENL